MMVSSNWQIGGIFMLSCLCGYAQVQGQNGAAAEPYANAEPYQTGGGGGLYPLAQNYGDAYNTGAGQQYAAPELGSSGLTCYYANGISGGCNGVGSVASFACGGDQFCYCYVMGSSYYGGCDDGTTNCVSSTFSNSNGYSGMCCTTSNCNVSSASAVALSRVLLFAFIAVILLSYTLH